MKRTRFLQRQLWLGMACILMVVCATIASTVMLMMAPFATAITPQMLEKAKTAGHSLNSLLSQAASFNIPFDKLVGVDTLFAEVAKKNPELVKFELSQQGKVLFKHETPYGQRGLQFSELDAVKRGDGGSDSGSHGGSGIDRDIDRDIDKKISVTLPVPGYESVNGMLSISIDPNFIRQLFQEMTLDLIVVVVVTLFISLELLYFMAAPLVADLTLLRAQLAILKRGVFVTLPETTWLGVDFSRALARRMHDMTARYRQAVVQLRAAIQARHDEGAQNQFGRHRARLAIAAMRDARGKFNFTDQRDANQRDANQLDANQLNAKGGRRFSRDANNGTNQPIDSHADSGGLLLGGMRAPFFLLLLADDLSRSFLPIFATGLSVGPLPISPNLVASLPIFLFMLIVALSQPLFGGWSERIGRRRSFLIAAAVAAVAHLLAAQSSTLLELLVWRSIGGASWAIGFVAAQGYVLDNTNSKNRTAGLAAFVSIIMVSLICGPSIGGLLADGLGYRLTMAVGGGLALLAFFLGWQYLPRMRTQTNSTAGAAAATATELVPQATPVTKAAFGSMWGPMLLNRRFLMLLLLAAVPAKIILIAYCYYLIPLYVLGAGSTSSMAGRIIMLYSVVMVLLVPFMGNWVGSLRARHHHRPEAVFVSVGLMLSGLAGLAMALPILQLHSSLGLLGPFIVVVLLGLGQALSISPQAAMVADICHVEIRTLGQSAVYGFYRMIERMGNAIGPLAAAALLEFGGFGTAFVTIGIGVLICAMLFAWAFLWSTTDPAKIQLWQSAHRPNATKGAD